MKNEEAAQRLFILHSHPELRTSPAVLPSFHPVKPLVLCLLLATAASAQPPLRVGTVTVRALDVYSSEEAGKGWFYRVADRLHIETRQSVVEKFLLFHAGEPYRPELLAQTERNLRGLRFLKSA